VTGLDEIVALEAGQGHTCARRDPDVEPPGTVLCWGANNDGQHGNGDMEMRRATPATALDLMDATDLALGAFHSCAVSGGAVYCWGANDQGQLGDRSLDPHPTPALVLGLSSVTQVAAGAVHTCAVHPEGVSCWGRNVQAQLGDGTTEQRREPTDVVFPGELVGDAVVQVAAGAAHTCARHASGHVTCWGNDDAGQLGDGTWGGDRPEPARVVAPAAR
jgi:alpha-tubulin suppressor-like RCC1 family protein